MRVYRSLEEVALLPQDVPRAVAIGTFDGVHVGHQRIIGMAVDMAHSMQGVPTVVTFEPHPGAVLRPNSKPTILTPLGVKVRLLERYGVEEVVAVPFTVEFATLEPAEFCLRLLSERLGARQVSVGANFRFGRGGRGTAIDLLSLGRDQGFSVSAIQLIKSQGDAVSSTRIRRLVAEGDVEDAARLLGRPHLLAGQVVAGVGRGRTLGMPTANLRPPEDAAVPGQGVYVTRTHTAQWPSQDSVTSIGTNPTFESDDVVHIETFLLDFYGTLYDAPLEIEFLARLRGQQAFATKELLVEQMHRDVEEARRILADAREAASDEDRPRLW
ncbi:MAG: bifunctional riboflavin kinase/FAD synthetase [Actinobacteria bacterium]|nr:bifunctional riboflavin kinase/FAD synthetase [Actinomycetota bacterium]